MSETNAAKAFGRRLWERACNSDDSGRAGRPRILASQVEASGLDASLLPVAEAAWAEAEAAEEAKFALAVKAEAARLGDSALDVLTGN